MDKELRIGIHKIKKLRESVKRRAEVYSFLGKLDDKGTAQVLNSLQRAPAPGKKIQKIGFILLFSPEPFTTIAGVPMILAGRYLDKVYNGATISDIGHETRKVAHHVSDLKHAIQ